MRASSLSTGDFFFENKDRAEAAGSLGDVIGLLGAYTDNVYRGHLLLQNQGLWIGKDGITYSRPYFKNGRWRGIKPSSTSGTYRWRLSQMSKLKSVSNVLLPAGLGLMGAEFLASDRSGGDWAKLVVGVGVTGAAVYFGTPFIIAGTIITVAEIKYGDHFYELFD